jgi:hypothetical protein
MKKYYISTSDIIRRFDPHRMQIRVEQLGVLVQTIDPEVT